MNGRVLDEEEILRGRYVDEIEEDGSSEEDLLRAAARMPFEEESLEEQTMECTPHPFTKDIQEEILKDFQDELERLQELGDEEEKEKRLKKKFEPVELKKTMIFAAPVKTKSSAVVEVVIKELVLHVERK